MTIVVTPIVILVIVALFAWLIAVQFYILISTRRLAADIAWDFKLLDAKLRELAK